MANEKISRDEEILKKLNAIAVNLESIQPAEYTDKDLQYIYTAIEEIRSEVEKLKDDYHTLDKQTATFIEKLNALEQDIDDFEKSEGVSEEKTKTFVTGIVTAVITGIVTYIVAQMKTW